VAHNPYAVTKRDVSSRELNERVPRPLGLLITAVINVVATALVSIFGPSVVEEYREVLKGFGSDVSMTTRNLLGSAWLWWALTVGALAMAVWVAKASTIPQQELRSMKIRVRAFTLLVGLLIALSMYSLYSSVLKVGDVV
jgi:hypothetical protein